MTVMTKRVLIYKGDFFLLDTGRTKVLIKQTANLRKVPASGCNLESTSMATSVNQRGGVVVPGTV